MNHLSTISSPQRGGVVMGIEYPVVVVVVVVVVVLMVLVEVVLEYKRIIP